MKDILVEAIRVAQEKENKFAVISRELNIEEQELLEEIEESEVLSTYEIRGERKLMHEIQKNDIGKWMRVMGDIDSRCKSCGETIEPEEKAYFESGIVSSSYQCEDCRKLEAIEKGLD